MLQRNKRIFTSRTGPLRGSFAYLTDTNDMFTEEQILALHACAKTGVDFPRYIQDLMQLGLSHYTFRLADGSTEYVGTEGYILQGKPRYARLSIADQASAEALVRCLKLHQAGGSDFTRFCRESAEAGVDRWVTDVRGMEVRYYSQANEVLLAEAIPEAKA